MQTADIAIIGAGPYGLSIGAHLRAAGRNVWTLGVPMQAWTNHMPQGMWLRSTPACSNLSDAMGELTLASFCNENGIPYGNGRMPMRRGEFIRYGLEFHRRFVPQIDQRRVVRLERIGDTYRLECDDGGDVVASRVVVATGYLPFRYIPPALRDFPATLISHSSDYGVLSSLRGKHVAVVGAGSSALDLAGLLSRDGNRVTLIARTPRLQMQQFPTGAVTDVSPRPSVRRPSSGSRGMGEGWLMRLCADAPQLIHHLPDSLRVAILESAQNPQCAGLADAPIDERVVIKLSRPVVRAQERAGRLQLTIMSADGSHELLDCDHVIAATGYRVDLRKLEFLSEGLLGELRMLDHSPVLSACFESSARGLYFAGLPAARMFGPALRSIQGAVHPARRITEHVFAPSRKNRTAKTRASVIRSDGYSHRPDA